MDLRNEILKSLNVREGELGISTAARYCTGNEYEMKAASQQLIYQDPEAEVVTKSISTFDVHGKDYFSFDHILTTKSQDRDGDIVEPAGLNIDPNLVLIWQHDQKLPIGKMFEVLEQSSNRVMLKSGIAPTKLGEDAILLVEMGAVKISQGFKPIDAEPIDKKRVGGKEVVNGWHVKKANCLEHSLVSIPANSDCIISAFSRKKLQSDVTKKYAQKLWDEKPAQVPGFSFDHEINIKL